MAPMSRLALLIYLLALAHGAQSLALIGGGSLSVTANNEATFNLVGGTKLVITATADAEVTITAKTAVTTAIPTGFESLTLGAYSGLEIKLSAGSIITAKLTTSPASATTTIVTGVQAGCLRFDASANTYTYIDGAKYNTDKTMTVNLPSTGFYTFVSAKATVPLPTFYAEARVTSSSEVKTYSYGGGELTLGVQTMTDNKITCIKKSNSTAAEPWNQMSIKAFFDITLEKEENVKMGKIKYTYDSTAVTNAGTTEASLRFMFKNDAGVWTAPDGGSSVDVSAKVVVANTAHFSEWGVFGDNALSVTANTDVAFELAKGTTLVIKATQDATLTVTARTEVTAAIPTGFESLTLGAYSGLEIKLSAGSIITAKLTTSPASATTTIVTGVQAGCLRFDASANTYTYIDGAKYNTDRTMTVNLPSTGFYIFVSAKATVPLPTLYAEARVTSSSEVKTYSYGGGKFTLGVQTKTDNTITCTKKSSSTTAAPTDRTSINAFFDITLEKEENVKKGEIKYTYDADAVTTAGTTEASLRFMFKNDAGVWTAPDGGSSVDISTKVVLANTNHFSEWGVFGDKNSVGDKNSDSDSSAAFLTRGPLAAFFVACLASLFT